MEKVTADQVRTAISDHNITQWKLRECGICGVGLHYLFQDGQVGYQSACGCSSYDDGPWRRSYDDVAETLNMQRPDIRERMWHEMLGLPQPASADR